MQHLKKLMLSRPYEARMSDQSLIKSEVGETYIDLIYATRNEDGAYAMIYLPQNKPVSIDLSKISGSTKKAWWFNPRTGESTSIKSIKGKSVQLFTPPIEEKDWVLVIDDASKKFLIPGAK
jgi:Putative collagen-binding domain of a collagenase